MARNHCVCNNPAGTPCPRCTQELIFHPDDVTVVVNDTGRTLAYVVNPPVRPTGLLPCPECAGKGFQRFDPFNAGTGRETRCGRCRGRGTLAP